MKEKDVQLYAIGISDGWIDYEAEQGRELLRKLAAFSGGKSFFPPSVDDLEDICRVISLELKNQYVIGYHSTNTAHGRKMSQDKGYGRGTEEQADRSRKTRLLCAKPGGTVPCALAFLVTPPC